MKAIEVLLNHENIKGNQSTAARILGTSQANVSYWSNHKGDLDMPIHMIPKAAQAIGLRPSQFIALVFG
jgi:DNA-binding transcriptional regulator YdaS (Cro superfamily)